MWHKQVYIVTLNIKKNKGKRLAKESTLSWSVIIWIEHTMIVIAFFVYCQWDLWLLYYYFVTIFFNVLIFLLLLCPQLKSNFLERKTNCSTLWLFCHRTILLSFVSRDEVKPNPISSHLIKFWLSQNLCGLSHANKRTPGNLALFLHCSSFIVLYEMLWFAHAIRPVPVS